MTAKKILQKLASPWFHSRGQYNSSIAIKRKQELERCAGSFFDRLNTQASIDTWQVFIKEVCQRISSEDIRNFLQWPAIKGSMFVSNSKFAKAEYQVLRNDAQWAERWRPATREVSVGSPQLFVKDHGSSGNLVHHTYLLSRLEALLEHEVGRFDFVYEFGGGYGDMAKLFGNLGFSGRYLIYDFELFSRLQAWYLSCLGRSTVVGEIPVDEQGQSVVYHCVFGDPRFAELSELARANKSLFLATWSLSETPISFRSDFESLMPSFDTIMLTYQHRIEDIDNRDYFDALQSRLASHTWHHISLPFQPTSCCLVGVRKY